MAAPTGTRLWESINENGCCSLPRLAHNIKCTIKGQLKDCESFLMIVDRAVALEIFCRTDLRLRIFHTSLIEPSLTLE
jgi:hypothetical protein